ncbi:beta-fructofuranosidase, insoluble isoenzyme 4-like isoform X2 [Triticum urartu]|uniref:beta-fructofuranosidase, insoluble isoenzyme 4-like isoform X2 n=1 Tax=Triticum urartu TaxID=4572 RepID=UPI002042F477|nr:beta-fructofuranosidase, insoluble isoenzyme 4-like isoform X2 [Triticum urartu]
MSVFTVFQIFCCCSWLAGLACMFSTSVLFQILVRPCSNGGVFFCSQSSTKIPSIVSKRYRTAYHFQPPKNWMNDPSGPMYYNDIYHEFYQYNPDGSNSPSLSYNIVWGHSVSTDLVNWIGLEPVLVPDTPSDICGCWTGSATILPGNQPAITYTGLINMEKHQVQNIALPKNRSDPYLREWTKAGNNPVIQPVIPGLNSSQFRDPTTGWIGPDGLWRIAVGADLNGSSTALLYKSEDFLNWNSVEHPLYSSNSFDMWECLDFFAVLSGSNGGLDMSSAIPNGAKHVLKMGMDYSDKYMIGVYDLKRDVFVPDTVIDDYRLWLRIDYGNFYASKSFFDSKQGRRIIWAWSNETDASSDDVAKGWAGIHSIPRTIWLDSDGKRLLQWPVEEIESLRRNEINHQGLELKKGDLFEIKGIDTLQADVEIDFELTSIDDAEPFDPSWLLDAPKQCREADASVHGGIGPFGLVILASDNMEEQTVVHFRVYKSQEKYMILMCTDLRRSSLRPGLYTPAYGGFFEFDLEKERKISLRTLIDRSAVESFGGGGRVCIMARVYPVALVNDDGGPHMFAFNNGSATVRVPQLRAWSMRRAQVSV